MPRRNAYGRSFLHLGIFSELHLPMAVFAHRPAAKTDSSLPFFLVWFPGCGEFLLVQLFLLGIVFRGLENGGVEVVQKYSKTLTKCARVRTHTHARARTHS